MDFEILIKEYRQCRNNQHKGAAILALMSNTAKVQASDFNYGRYLYFKAENLYFNNKINQSLKTLRKAYAYLIKFDESIELVSCLNLFGVLADLRGDYPSALDYYYKAIDVAERVNSNIQVMVIANNIGNLFFGQKAYKEAILCFKQALAKARRMPKKVRLDTEVIFRLNLGHAYALGAYTKQATVQLHKLEQIDQQLFRNKSFDLNFLNSIILCHQKAIIELEKVATQLMIDINQDLPLEASRMVINNIELWLSCGLNDLVWHSLQVVTNILAKIKASHFEAELQMAYIKYYQAIGDSQKVQQLSMAYIKSIEKDEDKQRLNRVLALKDKMELHNMNNMLTNTMQQAVTDQLTGIYNRRYLMDHVVNRYNKVKGLNQEIGFLILDIDYFKQCNDQYGHLYGDKCLKALSSIIKQVISDDIIAIRYGGDEFMLVFFNQSHQQISDVATFIQQAVTKLQYHSDKVTNRLLSVSIGIYIGKPYQDDNIYDFIRNADKALYKAKESKNTISIFEQ